MEPSAISPEEWNVWRTFYLMRRQLDVELERQLQRDAAISGADYEVLVALFEAPDRRMRIRELGRHLGWEKSRVSHQLTRMERRGLITRAECDTDARGTWAYISADGRRAVLGAMRDHAKTIRSLFLDLISEDEKGALLGISQRILDAMSTTDDDSARA